MVPRPTPQCPGELGHGDVLSLIPRPGQPGLLRGELGESAAEAAAGPRGPPAHCCPLGDQLPLELGKGGEDVKTRRPVPVAVSIPHAGDANATPHPASVLTVSTRSAAKCTSGGDPGLMTTSSHSHARGRDGAASKAEEALLAASRS